MTRYFDQLEWTEEKSKRADEKMEKIKQYTSVADPLKSRIEDFVSKAKKGCITKKARDKLLREIDDAERLGIKLKIDHPESYLDQERIKVLGAYQLCADYKR
jgi:endonuclease IV